MKDPVITSISVIDLDALPESVMITYKYNDFTYILTPSQVRGMLGGGGGKPAKPGRGNREARSDREKAMARAGVNLANLFRAIDMKDEEKIQKYMKRCDAIMGPDWTAAKLAERSEALESKKAG